MVTQVEVTICLCPYCLASFSASESGDSKSAGATPGDLRTRIKVRGGSSQIDCNNYFPVSGRSLQEFFCPYWWNRTPLFVGARKVDPFGHTTLEIHLSPVSCRDVL